MNKIELITAISEDAGLSKKDAEKFLDSFTNVVTEKVSTGNKVQLIGFGSFELSERAAREGRNPKTGETMTIPAHKTPKFKAGKLFKEMVRSGGD